MNLLDRLSSIKHVIKPGLVMMIPVFLSCESADDIGIPYELESDANVRFVDLTLPASTVFVDSLRTDSENRILIGRFQDDLTGLVSTESYFSTKYFTSDVPDDIEDDFIFDSVRISMISPVSVGNTGGTQSFNINVLTDTISNVIYLSSNRQQAVGDLIGSYEAEISADTNYFNFRLSDDFGRMLLENAMSLDPLAGSTDWPAFVVSPNASSVVINQINLDADTARIFLYVTDPEGASGIKEIVDNDTTFNDTTYTIQFRMDPSQALENPHYVNIDRSGVVSSLPDNVQMIDVLAGITTSVSMQPLQDFFDERIQQNQTIIINNASLTFELEEDSQRDTLENFYGFFYKNQKFFAPGLVVSPFSSMIMSDNALLQGSNVPVISTLNTANDRIVINATLFFQSMFNDYSADSETSVLLNRNADEVSLVDFIMLSEDDVTLNRSLFKEDGITIRIFYTEVD